MIEMLLEDNFLSDKASDFAYPVKSHRRLAITLEYDGTNYRGFQPQTGELTVQGELERALKGLTGIPTKTWGAGRTDAGAHAMGQVVAFDTEAKHSLGTFTKALNAVLPADIRVQKAWDMDAGFNPRFHAVSRVYRYLILNQVNSSPLHDRFVYHHRGYLNVPLMNEAVEELIGTHDFRQFCMRRSLGNRNTIRTMTAASVTMNGRLIQIELEADGFLPHQVRSICGTLIRVGKGILSIGEFATLLQSDQQVNAGPVLPAKGLYLIRVNFGPNWNCVKFPTP